jgi:delta24-sterol reductase
MLKNLIPDLLTKHRTLVLAGIGLPVGTVFDAVLRARNFLYERFASAPQEHEERVRDVQHQVRRWAAMPKEERRPLCTDRKTWMNLSTRFVPKHTWHRIRMSGLRDILELDEQRQLVRVEPFVTVGQISRFLLPRGYMLAVTLEIDEATLGGLAMAVGMTTHSHKVGLFQENVAAYEVVLADGSLVRATATEHPDLFHSLPWSHGTLGLLVGLELKVIPIKPYVRLQYTPAHSQKEYCERIRELAVAPDGPDFIEATVYSKERAVIMTGRFADAKTDEDRRKINPIGRPYKPWFYKHVEQFLDHEGEELIPLRHYLSRHNRSIFWVVADMIPMGNHPLFRALVGWMMPPKIAFIKFSTTAAVRKMTFTLQVFQDIVLPTSAMAAAVNKVDALFGMYPLLIYPSRIYDHQGRGQLRRPSPSELVPGSNHAMYFDLGVYGVPGPIRKGQRFRTVHAMREMEAFTQQVRGFPFLYADTFMTREEFREMFDLTLYDKVRREYGAEGTFPDLYDKIKPEVDVLSVLEEEKSYPPLATQSGEAKSSHQPQAPAFAGGAGPDIGPAALPAT